MPTLKNHVDLIAFCFTAFGVLDVQFTPVKLPKWESPYKPSQVFWLFVLLSHWVRRIRLRRKKS